MIKKKLKPYERKAYFAYVVVHLWSDVAFVSTPQEFRREGWTEKRSAVCFCLGSGFFGSYNSD